MDAGTCSVQEVLPDSPVCSPTGSVTENQGQALGPAEPVAGQQRRRRECKINGMDAYDYWCLIRSL